MSNCMGVHTEIVHLERTARMSAHCCVIWFLVSRIKKAGGTFVLELNEVDRPRLYHAQLELDGTLMLGRDNVCWLFEIAAAASNCAGIAGGRETIVLALAPVPRRRRRDPTP